MAGRAPLARALWMLPVAEASVAVLVLSVVLRGPRTAPPAALLLVVVLLLAGPLLRLRAPLVVLLVKALALYCQAGVKLWE